MIWSFCSIFYCNSFNTGHLIQTFSQLSDSHTQWRVHAVLEWSVLFCEVFVIMLWSISKSNSIRTRKSCLKSVKKPISNNQPSFVHRPSSTSEENRRNDLSVQTKVVYMGCKMTRGTDTEIYLQKKTSGESHRFRICD